MERPVAILFDIDGTLISSGGAGARSWDWAFRELHGVPADIGAFTDSGMTDPEVGRLTFASVIGREPSPQELWTLIGGYLDRLPHEVRTSKGYKVLPNVEKTLQRLTADRIPLGITSGAVEAAAHIKLSRAGLNRYFSFGGYGSDSADRVRLTRRALERGDEVLGKTLHAPRVLVVGDTPSDIDAAHGVGAVGVGVATGKFSAAELEAAGSEHVLASLREPLPGFE